jgi:hypothetical protein
LGTGETILDTKMRRLFYFVLVALIVAGCAKSKSVAIPTPPPPSLLSPEVGHKEEVRLKNDAKTRIERAEKIVQQIDLKKLAREQQEILSSTRSFISKAKKALANKDYLRALNLADKAQILAEELSKTLL